MADGLCTDDPIGDVIEKTASNACDNAVRCETIDSMTDSGGEKVKDFLIKSESGEIFNNLCAGDGAKHEGILEEDCRKKRCVDRYDSSESSDSGVAVLSCTDCSGSSTASSDITEPGSPFSTTSSHSEDSGSGSQPAKMPPTQTAHHPPWPWTADEGPPCKRSLLDKTQTTAAFPKTLKSAEEQPKKKPTVSATPFITKSNFVKIVPSIPSPNDKLTNAALKKGETPRMQQGKITEYFKSQVKSNGIKKDIINNMVKKNVTQVTKTLVDQQTQFNSLKTPNRKELKKPIKKSVQSKVKKVAPVTVPRKILPAPSNMTEKLTISDQLNSLAKFTPTVTLTALSFPPNYTYLHTKGPKPPEAPIFVPQYATIANDKLPLPIINRTPCLNVIQPVQKLTTINNFNCVKLNATVVPIVKVNPMPSRLNTSVNPPVPSLNTNPNISNVVPSSNGPNLSVETGIPTVLSAKPKIAESAVSPIVPLLPIQHNEPNITNTPLENVRDNNSRTEEPHRTEKCTREEIFRDDLKETSPTPTTDSDSGISISNKECLEVFVSETVAVEEQKSPILSKPKTIRFPCKQIEKEEGKSPQHSTDGQCRWAECSSCFDTSGALLEHLQVKHVISQATQEHYVCLWLGCKVHGRTSCSRSWLERHVLAHAGTKPFRCIVDGCGQRFNSQLALERHVNSHFNSDGSPNNNLKKSPENTCKLFKRNGKRIRFRRQPWSARMFDFIDSGIMEGLQYKLLLLTQKRTLGKINEPGNTVHLQSEILARRVETDGCVKFLLRWHPNDIIADEWVSEKEYKPTREVSIPHLEPSSKTALSPSLFPSQVQPRQKRSRKQIPKQT